MRQHYEVLWANIATPMGREYLPEAILRACQELLNNSAVLVHCMRGRHRTGFFSGILQVSSVNNMSGCLGVRSVRVAGVGGGGGRVLSCGPHPLFDMINIRPTVFLMAFLHPQVGLDFNIC